MMGVLPSLGSVSRLEYVLQLPFSKKDLFQEGRITVFLLIHLNLWVEIMNTILRRIFQLSEQEQ